MTPLTRSALVALVLATLPPLASSARAQRPSAPDPMPASVQRTGSGAELVSSLDGASLVYVPAAEFTRGAEGAHHDEAPPHRVQVAAFLIDRLEVTNARYQRYLDDSGATPRGPWWRGAGQGHADHPVRFVTWHDALAYCQWAGRTLPSEVQWELAARGPRSLTYPWGPKWRDGLARVDLAVDAGPSTVGAYPGGASPCGAMDMAGNVWEWVHDWYDRYYYQRFADIPVAAEPRGPEDGAPPEPRFVDSGTAAGNERSTRKVIRGGGWVRPGRYHARGSRRMWGNPAYWFNDTGFRCALPLPAAGAAP